MSECMLWASLLYRLLMHLSSSWFLNRMRNNWRPLTIYFFFPHHILSKALAIKWYNVYPWPWYSLTCYLVHLPKCTWYIQTSFTVKNVALKWNVAAEPWKTPGFLASRGQEFNPGPVTRLDRSKLLFNKFLLKYKRDRQSFWHRHQKEAEVVPPLLVIASCFMSFRQLLIR